MIPSNILIDPSVYSLSRSFRLEMIFRKTEEKTDHKLSEKNTIKTIKNIDAEEFEYGSKTKYPDLDS